MSHAAVIESLIDTGPPPVGAPRPGILPVRIAGDRLTVSGQTAVRPDGSLLHHGLVNPGAGPAGLGLAEARECAWLCAANVLRAVDNAVGLDAVAQVDRITVYVACDPAFIEQHLVADAATDFFLACLGERGRHSRAAIGVASLPTGSPVEVDAIIRLTPARPPHARPAESHDREEKTS